MGTHTLIEDDSFMFSMSPTGQRTLHHRSNVLETVVLVNPSEDTAVSEVSLMNLRYLYRWDLFRDKQKLKVMSVRLLENMNI